MKPEQIAQAEDTKHIEHNITQHKPEVPPLVVIIDIKPSGEELVRRAHATELTCRRRLWVGQIPSRKRYESIHVLSACLSRWRVEVDEFDGGAVDGLSAHSLAQQAFNEVCVRR